MSVIAALTALTASFATEGAALSQETWRHSYWETERNIAELRLIAVDSVSQSGDVIEFAETTIYSVPRWTPGGEWAQQSLTLWSVHCSSRVFQLRSSIELGIDAEILSGHVSLPPVEGSADPAKPNSGFSKLHALLCDGVGRDQVVNETTQNLRREYLWQVSDDLMLRDAGDELPSLSRPVAP